MLLGFLTIVIMAVVAYAYWREGLMTACTMFLNVFLAGMVAFNFWEPAADLLDPMFANNFLHGWEDFICLAVLFSFTLGILRLITNNLAHTDLEYPPGLLRGGGLFFGLATGYLVSGFLVCVFQTVPWHENFMGFDPDYDAKSSTRVIRAVLPPDRVWLGMMQRAGAYSFSNPFTAPDPDAVDPRSPQPRFYGEAVTFDKYSTFELRYKRHRRYSDKGDPLPDGGEFDRQVHRQKK
jgi:uncharacterized membrane protein required for colicin V production